ncbi:MAG: quinone oxidoreductase [Comamonadaceae bacterium]|nr:MAG: quinone oxidoreductase [Comamonadaceae bacterium]
MKASIVCAAGPRLADIAVPVPGAEQILVRVKAAALNRADLHVAAGHRHGTSGGDGTVIGIEWSGEIAGVGEAVPAGFAVGDAVMCSGTGAYAEYAVTDWGRVYKMPAGLDFRQAAALPIALQTSHEALAGSGALRRGESVLVQGASSGVGLMTLQVARELGAGLVMGTSTTASRRERLGDFGAHLAFDPAEPDWPARVHAATSGSGCDLVVDFVAGAAMNANMQAARICGRIVNVGRMGGFTGEFDFDLHSLRRIRYIGVTFRTRSREEVRAIASEMKRDLWPALSAGRLRMPVSRHFALADAAAALEFTRANLHFGKVVLDI